MASIRKRNLTAKIYKRPQNIYYRKQTPLNAHRATTARAVQEVALLRTRSNILLRRTEQMQNRVWYHYLNMCRSNSVQSQVSGVMKNRSTIGQRAFTTSQPPA